MREIKDQMNKTIRLESKPRRIVSLVPSQTELLYFLGLRDEVVGITKFCIYPEKWFRTKKRVGGTKFVDLELVRELKPDLIIGNKEENKQEDIEALHKIAPVWMSDIYTLSDALEMIESLGELTETESESSQLKEKIIREFKSLDAFVNTRNTKGKTALYFIWNDPDRIAGSETFIDNMFQQCGFANARSDARYPSASHEENPDFVFLSSEPFPFKQEHIEKFQTIYPKAKVVLVDGEMFSWYGAKLLEAPHYFKALLDQLSVE